MKFNADGYLDAGLHQATLSDIKTHLVDTFPPTSTRLKVYKGYKRHTEELETFGFPINQFVDGSFVSSKKDPGDVDLLGIADRKTVDALPAAERQRLNKLFLGEANKLDYECHTFFLASVPETDPAFAAFRATRKYWMGEFGFDRVDKPKGILTLAIQPRPPTPTPQTPIPAPTAP